MRDRAVPRIPLNTLAIAFGLAGLAGVWSTAARLLGLSAVPADVLWLVAATAWVWLILAHLLRGRRSPESLASQLRHPAQGPIAALVPIVGMLLGAQLHTVLPRAGAILVVASIVVAAVFAGWVLSFWVSGQLKPDTFHPGFLLPTVAGGFVASATASAIGLPALAVGCFAVGLLFWAVIFPILLARFAFLPGLPAPLVPTLAIIVAPPVVGGTAWFAMSGERADPVSVGFLALGIVLTLMQLALIPRYRTLPFSLGFWSFTFPFAAVARYGMEWSAVAGFPGWQLIAWALLVMVTVLIVGIAIRSVVLVSRERRGSRSAERELLAADRRIETA